MTYQLPPQSLNPVVCFVQIRSDEEKIKKISYTITGPGADEGRIGLFYMDRDTGNLYLTQSLDREEQDKYTVSILSDVSFIQTLFVHISGLDIKSPGLCLESELNIKELHITAH